VSDDGATVAANWYENRWPQRAIVRAFDVASGAQTMEDVLVTNSLHNPAYGLAISADGSRIVVGCWGDGTSQIAEVRLYSNDRDAPLEEFTEGGSVQDVDISPDGHRFAASRASNHFDSGIVQTFVEVYESGEEDLVVRGRPSIGSTITLEAHATPGTAAYLLSARSLAPVPIEVPGVGLLHLDPSTLARQPLGRVPPSGVVTLPVSIPNEAAAVGRKYYYQLVSTDPRELRPRLRGR
jgi:dipeptidyl aminopeptidase/acylaminoacyl peptidase